MEEDGEPLKPGLSEDAVKTLIKGLENPDDEAKKDAASKAASIMLFDLYRQAIEKTEVKDPKVLEKAYEVAERKANIRAVDVEFTHEGISPEKTKKVCENLTDAANTDRKTVYDALGDAKDLDKDVKKIMTASLEITPPLTKQKIEQVKTINDTALAITLGENAYKTFELELLKAFTK